jgi:hypothetical protein
MGTLISQNEAYTSLSVLGKDRVHMPKSTGLTFEDVNNALSYNPETGDILWIRDVSKNVKAGTIAGTYKGVRHCKKTGREVSYRYIRLNNIETPAARVAWLLHYGEWPFGNILFKDNDSTNLKIDNLTQGRFPMPKAAGKIKNRQMSKDMMRHYGLQRYYGLTGEQYGEMMAAQNGVCAICSKPETAIINGTPKVMHVDHDHATGKIRALLCGSCNGMLGLAKDSRDVLIAAVRYLDKHTASVSNVVTLDPVASDTGRITSCQE